MDDPTDRRAFLKRLVVLGGAALVPACGAPATAALKAAAPLPAPPQPAPPAPPAVPACGGFSTGAAPGSFAIGCAELYEDRHVFVCRDARGLYALDAFCTHEGCLVGPSDDGFACICHGSRYSRDGDLVRGPARRPLVHYAVCLGSDGRVG